MFGEDYLSFRKSVKFSRKRCRYARSIAFFAASFTLASFAID
jgi:hypothetical protein